MKYIRRAIIGWLIMLSFIAILFGIVKLFFIFPFYSSIVAIGLILLVLIFVKDNDTDRDYEDN